MGYVVGIDLGTTFSAAAIAEGDRVEAVTLGTASPAIPSVVVLRAEGQFLVGEAAERRSIAEPTRTAREFKRRLGDPAPIVLGGTPFGAEALSARLLRWIVGTVSLRQGAPPDLIVITHPANYGAYKLDLLHEMVRLADVRPVEFLAEPQAAAISYAQRNRIDPDQTVAIYDFGGGTFDAAVLLKTASGFKLIGRPEGMERLGGIDFDQAIFDHVDRAVGGQIREADTREPAVRTAVSRLRIDCRAAKESLSSDTDAAIPVMLPALQTEVRLTRSEFEAMIRPRVEETIASLGRAVRSTELEMSAIDRILLVGGSSRIPLIEEEVRAATGRPTAVDADPKLSIALGAARYGALLLEERTTAWAGVAAAGTDMGLSAAPEMPTAVSADMEPVEPVAPATSAALGAQPAATARGANSTASIQPGGPRLRTSGPGKSRSKRNLAVAVAAAAVLALAGGSLLSAAVLGGRPASTTPTGTPIGLASPTGLPSQTGLPSPTGTVVATGSNPAVSQLPASLLPDGVFTLAGTGQQGSSGDGRPAAQALLGTVTGLAVGSDGAVYISDGDHGTIRVVRGGKISTLVQDLVDPAGLAVDSSGRVFVAETGRSDVVRIDRGGKKTVVAGIPNHSGLVDDGGGVATKNHLDKPLGVALDSSGNLYIADSNFIYQVDSRGKIGYFAGSGSCSPNGDGVPAREADVCLPAAIAAAPDGSIYVSDWYSQIRRIGTDGIIRKVAGTGTLAGNDTSLPIAPNADPLNATLFDIHAIAVDGAGNVYAGLRQWGLVVRIDTHGTLAVVVGGGTDSNDNVPPLSAVLASPGAIAVGPAGSTLYIGDGSRVRYVSLLQG